MKKIKEKNRYRVQIINLDEARTVKDQMDFETLRDAMSLYDYLSEVECDCLLELSFYDKLDPRNNIGSMKDVEHWRMIDIFQC
jgi:hypothetical protein